VGYSSNMLFVSFTYFPMGQVNRLIPGIYLDSKSAGMYTISDTVAQLSVFFFTTFSSIFAAIISELYHTGDRETLAKMYADITRWIVSLTLPLAIWMLAFPEQILSIFGKEYMQAKYVLMFLAIGQWWRSWGERGRGFSSLEGSLEKKVYNSKSFSLGFFA